MRKRLKLKNRSCSLCKPFKMRGANRWKLKDLEALKRFERDQASGFKEDK